MSDMLMEFGVLDIQTITLEVSYWSDKKYESGLARLIVKEGNTRGTRGRGFI